MTLKTECSTGLDIDWEDSADYLGSKEFFLQKKSVHYQWVRPRVWDPGIAKTQCKAVLAFVAYGLAFG